MELYTNNQNDFELHSLVDDIKHFLLSNSNNFFTPSEISEMINSIPFSTLKSTLSLNNSNYLSDPSDYINSVCLYLSKQELLKQSKKVCPYKGVITNSFSI